MNSFFNKNVYTQGDVKSLIDNQIEESINLDYKSGKAIESRKEIAKDVSAFANSEGGIIIYGVDEIDHKPSDYSFIDGRKFTKETL